MCKNLDMFARVRGDGAAERVRLMSTLWDKAKDVDLAESGVSHLGTNFGSR